MQDVGLPAPPFAASRAGTPRGTGARTAAPWPTAQQAQHCIRSVCHELRERAVWRAQHNTIQSSQHQQHCVAVVSTAGVRYNPHNPAWQAQHSNDDLLM
jgi:hypothetical protein